MRIFPMWRTELGQNADDVNNNMNSNAQVCYQTSLTYELSKIPELKYFVFYFLSLCSFNRLYSELIEIECACQHSTNSYRWQSRRIEFYPFPRITNCVTFPNHQCHAYIESNWKTVVNSRIYWDQIPSWCSTIILCVVSCNLFGHYFGNMSLFTVLLYFTTIARAQTDRIKINFPLVSNERVCVCECFAVQVLRFRNTISAKFIGRPVKWTSSVS